MSVDPNQQIRLAVGVPAYGGEVTVQHGRMWTEFGNVIGASDGRFRMTMFGFVDVNPIDRARNQLLAQAMLHTSTWLLMVDADTWAEGDDIDDAGVQLLRMVSDAARRGAVLVGAPVVLRSTGQDAKKLNVYLAPGEDGKHVPLDASWVAEQRRALVPVHAIGAAICAINLTKLAELDIDPPVSYAFTPKLSEDLDFCRQIREHFGDSAIYADPRVITGHSSRSFPLYAR